MGPLVPKEGAFGLLRETLKPQETKQKRAKRIRRDSAVFLFLTLQEPIETNVTMVNKNAALLRCILFPLFGLVFVGLIVTNVTTGLCRAKKTNKRVSLHTL